MDLLTNLLEGILSQCLRYVYQITTIVYFKYLTISFVNYTSVKMKKKKVIMLK